MKLTRLTSSTFTYRSKAIKATSLIVAGLLAFGSLPSNDVAYATAPTWGVLAAGERASVLAATTGNNTTSHNGSQWYYKLDSSMGFAPSGSSVVLAGADVLALPRSGGYDVTSDFRLSWHLSSTQMYFGFRHGRDEVNDSTVYRAVYEANVLPSYYPSGPQKDIPAAQLVGWTRCYQGPSNGSILLTDLWAQCTGTYLLFAGGTATYRGDDGTGPITPVDTPPSFSSSTPADNSTDVEVSSNIDLTFSESIKAGTGSILIKKSSDDTTAASIPIGDAQVTISGSTLSINPAANLEPDTSYYIMLANGVVLDLADNAFEGIADSTTLSFTTGVAIPGTPGTPVAVAADSSATVSVVAPSSGGPIVSYLVTAAPGGATCTVTPPATSCVVSGLTNGTSYTFASTATNASGTSASSVSSSVVTPAADDSGDTSGGSGSSGTSAAKFKPGRPSADDASVTKGAGSLNVGMIYSGSTSYKPASYTVKVSPGGNSCVITGASSSCEVIGLETGVEYTVSISATNKFGTSAATVLPSKYILTEAGLLRYESKKTLAGFAGGSAKLTNSFKASIKKHIYSNAGLSAVTCTGYTAGKPVIKGDKALARARAKAVCAHVEKIKPSLITTVVGKTPGLGWGPANRKVMIRGYSTLG